VSVSFIYRTPVDVDLRLASPGESETDENPWEFDTVRGRSFDASGLGTPQVTLSEDQASATVKQQSSKLPTSLRHLFDADVTTAPDPFRIPGFSAASKDSRLTCCATFPRHTFCAGSSSQTGFASGK